MKNRTPFTWLLSLTFLFTACHDKEAETAIPDPEATMDRTITFHREAEEDKASYTLTYPEATMKFENNALETRFAPSRPAGKDEIIFNISGADVRNGYVGKYKVNSAGISQADVIYYHYMSTGDGSVLISDGNNMEGEFEITSFDPRNQTASGRYSVVIKNEFDPTRYNYNQANPRTCDITVTGSFEGLNLMVRR